MSEMTKYERLSHERKRLQSEGLAPSWLSTSGYQLLTEKSYLNTAETPKRMYERIAERASMLTDVRIPPNFGYDDWNLSEIVFGMPVDLCFQLTREEDETPPTVENNPRLGSTRRLAGEQRRYCSGRAKLAGYYLSFER